MEPDMKNQKKKMPWNEEGSRTEQFCAWVPCTDYLKERERERDTQKSTKQHQYQNKRRMVRMHEKCMNM